MSRFLRYRFAAHIAWPVLLLGTGALAIAVTGGIETKSVRMVIVWASVAAAFFVGLRIQQRMLDRVDPEGSLRDTLRSVHARDSR
jgi:membrane protein DedA with SNARE-associated domain